MEKWIPAQSPARPHSPSRASTSFTSWPFPTPPKDGLQDRAPRKEKENLHQTVHTNWSLKPWHKQKEWKRLSKEETKLFCLFNEALPLTDSLYFLWDQECLSSHSGCCCCRLSPRMTPTHNNDIILLSGKVTGTSGNQYKETLQGGKLLGQHVRCTPVEGEWTWWPL